MPVRTLARRLLIDHRRSLAALCAFVAVWAALSSVQTATESRRGVVAVARDLPSGHRLSAKDLTVTQVPTSTQIGGTRRDPSSWVGQRLAGAMRHGEFVTDRRVLGPDLLPDDGEQHVITSVPVTSESLSPAVEVGSSIDVLAIDMSEEATGAVVAEHLQVLAVRPGEDPTTTVLDVAASRETAIDLARTARVSTFAALPTRGEPDVALGSS